MATTLAAFYLQIPVGHVGQDSTGDVRSPARRNEPTFRRLDRNCTSHLLRRLKQPFAKCDPQTNLSVLWLMPVVDLVKTAADVDL